MTPRPSRTVSVTSTAAMQSIMPSAATVTVLVMWHQQALSWTHGSLSTSAVMALVKKARTIDGRLDLTRLELQDVGIILACLAGTITNAPELSANGIAATDSAEYGRMWYMAALACLASSRPDVRHIRIIQILFLSSESLGKRQDQLKLLQGVSALRASTDYTEELYNDTIDRLALGPLPRATSAYRQQRRHVWSQLCVQSWLATHAMDPEMFEDEEGADDETGYEADRSVLESVAYVQPSFKERMHKQIVQIGRSNAASTPDFKLLVRSDNDLRALTTDTAYVDHLANQVAHSHILLLLHHKHFVNSLTDEQWAFSRWASIEAARHIVVGIEEGLRQGILAVWTFLCPLVTAAITLSNVLRSIETSSVDKMPVLEALDRAVTMIRGTCYSEMVT